MRHLTTDTRAYATSADRKRAMANIDRHAKKTRRCAYLVPYRDTNAQFALNFVYKTSCPHIYSAEYHPTGTAHYLDPTSVRPSSPSQLPR
jgi:hypothetical protein